jgi:hypothetical protein
LSLEPKVTRPPFDDKAMLTLSEAACLLSGICTSRQDAEMMLALAIELGELRACVKQWDVEQWSAEKIPGYLSCRASFIARRDREGWLAGHERLVHHHRQSCPSDAAGS